MEVQRAGLAVAVGADFIGQALPGFGRVRLGIPRKGASLETEILAAGFRLDRAAALIDVKRIDGAKKFHDEFLGLQAPGSAPVG